MLPKAKFDVGETVLCDHQSLMWLAKVTKWNAESCTYYIHYQGWDKRWDEWVTPNRLHKHNDANIQLQRELAAKCKAIKNPKGQIKIFIPNKLKAWLKKDHDEITRNHKLLDIPAKKTVKHIIDAYIHMKNPTQSMTEKNKAEIDDFTGGLTSYFNVMLGSQLLYPSERPQHAKIMREHSDKSMANIYGAFHLLRMFVPLGPILNSAKMNAKSTRILQEHLKNFIEFIAQYDTSLFSKPDFVNP